MSEPRFQPSRRVFMGGLASAAAAGLLGALPAPVAAAGPRRRRGSLDDVVHVVILMQENRSLDHYYGTMRGVRGFGDKAALTLANGRSVFHQPDPSRADGGYLLPFHVDTSKVDGQNLPGNDHSWAGVQQQWAGGNNTGWITDTGEKTMAYFTKEDLPFNRELAQAYTFCDQYFCSIKGPTTPNRLFHWSGMIDPQGASGGPAISNPADYEPVYHWTTYPERLQRAGVSWQVYANDEVGDGGGADGYLGDYGDNPLWLFKAYHDALASPDPKIRQLADRASVRAAWKPSSGLGLSIDHVLQKFIGDCAANTLPAVSWVVAPYAYSEHPRARPVDGAAYTETVLNAIWSNDRLRETTAVFINYDEHDGFFDHIVPPTAPPGTPDEFVMGLPVGLGPRVPMTVVSPWSRAGWINSEVFDHTSVLRFLERWTGVPEPNISAWRRAICGDLTSCFDFATPDTTIALLPDTAALRKQADAAGTLPPATPPAPGQQTVPVQEPGVAPARALPYQPWANVTAGATSVAVAMGNAGSAALQMQVYDRLGIALVSQRVDVAPGQQVSTSVVAVGTYDVAVHGPNGFLREATGGAATTGVEVAVTIIGSASHPTLRITFSNITSGKVSVEATGLDAKTRTVPVAPGSQSISLDPVQHTSGWYDVTVTLGAHREYRRRFAGHLENGRPSITG
ncbi:MAG TPA: phospholipase C, phosphocholine-specific [Dermatophilaceae bacterium]